MFAKDALFAQLTLSDDEYRLYAPDPRRVAPQVPAPDLVDLAAAPRPRRCCSASRGAASRWSSGIDERYLERLSDAYAA